MWAKKQRKQTKHVYCNFMCFLRQFWYKYKLLKWMLCWQPKPVRGPDVHMMDILKINMCLICKIAGVGFEWCLWFKVTLLYGMHMVQTNNTTKVRTKANLKFICLFLDVVKNYWLSDECVSQWAWCQFWAFLVWGVAHATKYGWPLQWATLRAWEFTFSFKSSWPFVSFKDFGDPKKLARIYHWDIKGSLCRGGAIGSEKNDMPPQWLLFLSFSRKLKWNHGNIGLRWFYTSVKDQKIMQSWTILLVESMYLGERSLH